MITRFNLRVYAIVIRGDEILLADESINDFSYTKFPGGGVELGEGIMDALKRELMEEGEIMVNEVEHLYTTDFFQPSAFNPVEQIISVYYLVKADIHWPEYVSDQSSADKKHLLRLYFYPMANLQVEQLTFPIDQHVLQKLRQIN